MNTEKIAYQLFIGKVSEILGFDKTTQLLKEAKAEIEPLKQGQKLPMAGVVVSFFKRLKSKYTMTYKRSVFVDTVNGKMVNEYEDCYGNLFMAQSKLGFRTRKN